MMAELRAEYIATMPQKIGEIKAFAAAHNADALREAFHKLKGSGKTYGIAEVSELFEVCERHCLRKPELSGQVATLALKLFTAIYEARKNGKNFNVSDTEEFKALRSLC